MLGFKGSLLIPHHPLQAEVEDVTKEEKEW